VVPADGELVSHRRIAGDVAADIARQLAEPVRALRDRLGLVVDHLERHVAMSTGPAPYPWRSLQTLRHDLGATYLEATMLARRLEELDRALAAGDDPEWVDLGAAVDLGIRLAGHHLATGIEVMIDLGGTPKVRGVPGPLALIVAQLVGVCAESASGLPNSTLSIRTRAEEGFAVITVIDNGSGSDRVTEVGTVARDIVAPWGATLVAASEPGHGCAFELQLATAAG